MADILLQFDHRDVFQFVHTQFDLIVKPNIKQPLDVAYSGLDGNLPVLVDACRVRVGCV
jgi:hypothetical protein